MSDLAQAHQPILAIDLAYPAWHGVVEASQAQIEQAVALVIEHVAKHKTQFEISLVFANDDSIQELNKKYRDKNQPTNVLSFPQIEKFSQIKDMMPPVMLGDVILSWETVSYEAAQQEKILVHHMLHLIIHGVMHLLGFDHMTEIEAEEMEKIEIDILKQLHIPNPYL